MSVGIDARLERIGSNGRILNIPMDHGITIGATTGLKDIETTIDAVTRGGADSVLTQKGLATRVHPHKNDAGFIVHCNASTILGPDSNDKRPTCTVEEAVRVGADAVSFHINVGSEYEQQQITDLAELVREAHSFGLPVLAMTYARGDNLEGTNPEHHPEYLAHAVRVGEELGADVIKTAYSGDSESFEQVVNATKKPVIVAGGSPTDNRTMLEQARGARDAGAIGVSIGRSAFQHDSPEKFVSAVSRIIHDDGSVENGMEILNK